jgi:hypothetical protein
MSASGPLTGVRYIAEVTYGVTPATPTMLTVRMLDTSLNLKKETFQSNEIRSDRQISDLRHGLRTVGGNISAELSLTAFDGLLEMAMSSVFAAVPVHAAVNLQMTALTKKITRATGSWITDGYLPGHEAVIAGFTNGTNNGAKKIVGVTATDLTLAADTVGLVDEATLAGRTVTVTGKQCKTGTTIKSASIERAFTDINQFLMFTGCVVDKFSLDIKPGEIIKAQWDFLGKDMIRASVTGATAVTPAATSSPFDAYNVVIRENDILSTNISGMTIELDNGRSTKGVVGSNTVKEVFEGTCNAKGTVTMFFADGTMLDKFLAETPSSLDVKLLDPNGVDFHHIRLPKVKFNGSDINNPKEGPVVVTVPYQALLDTVSGTNILYQRSNVV